MSAWKLSATDLARIAEGASTPAERLRDGFHKQFDTASIAQATALWAEWGRHVSKGDAAVLAKVLGWRGLDVAACRASLLPVTLADPSNLPDWVVDLDRLLTEAADCLACSNPSCLQVDEPLANEALLWPFVEAAARWPRARLAAAGAPAEATASLERTLLAALCRASEAVLAMPAPALPFPRGTLCAYPVLGRLILRLCRNWTAALHELLDRLIADNAAIATFLGCCGPLVPERFSAGDGDSHDNGRRVVVVGFRGGSRIVYKPRSLALDHAFAGLITVLEEAGLDIGPVVPRVLRRTSYGWAEYVVHRLSADDAERTLFWRRAGATLGLLTAIGGNDIHCNNVIASGDHLAIIDLETVLQPGLREVGADKQQSPAAATVLQLLQRSPLSTAMLPVLVRNGDGVILDVGALTSPGNGGVLHRNTTAEPEQELLQMHGMLREGFSNAFRVLCEQRDALLAPGGPLSHLASMPVRLVFRGTQIYSRLHELSFEPHLLRDGAARDVALEQLSRMLAPYDAPPPVIGIVAAEKQAMDAMDIPRFEAAAGSLDLRDRHGVVAPGMFATSALDAARDRLRQVDATSGRLHLRIISLAVQARIVGHAGPTKSWVLATGMSRPTFCTRRRAIEAALAIGRALIPLALEGMHGTIFWLSPRQDLDAGRLILEGSFAGLGDGSMGIAVFLAALARCTGDAEIAALAAQAIPRLSAAEGYSSLALPPLGLTEGLGGRVWACATLARLGASAECRAMGGAAFTRGLLQRGATDWSLGTGLGGFLLAGLALHDVDAGQAPASELLKVARRLAMLLTDAATAADGLLTGLTGAGYALAVAASRMGWAEFFPVAQAALSAPGDDAGVGWGRGAAGRLVARHAATRLLPGGWNDKVLGELILRDAERVGSAGAEICDGFWAGGAGMLPALALADPERARHVEQRLAARALAGQLEPVVPALPGVVLPGLLNGVAGIGYALLCGADPTLPSLHLFG